MSSGKGKLNRRHNQHHPAPHETDGSMDTEKELLTNLIPLVPSYTVRERIICTRRCCDFHDAEVNKRNKEEVKEMVRT